MNDLFYKIYFWYKLIPCLHLSLLDNDVSPYHPLLLSTKTDLYFNIPFFFFQFKRHVFCIFPHLYIVNALNHAVV